jgi:hypothetical protein
MTLDEILKRATIPFPEPLEIEGIDRFIEHLAHYLQARINYSVKKDGNANALRGGVYLTETTSISLEGTITTSDASDSFSSGRDIAQSRLQIHQLQFSIIPGYQLQEYRPATIVLWDRTREVVNNYFEQKKVQKK